MKKAIKKVSNTTWVKPVLMELDIKNTLSGTGSSTEGGPTYWSPTS